MAENPQKNVFSDRAVAGYALEARIAEQLKDKAEVTCFNIGEKDVRACLACDANVPGSIMEKEADLKVADEFVEWLLA